ncbi:hypothetical protein PIB30_079243 [Stylosanthes scabra]|nr:hypothetical protein [Stylosanthes scabra]
MRSTRASGESGVKRLGWDLDFRADDCGWSFLRRLIRETSWLLVVYFQTPWLCAQCVISIGKKTEELLHNSVEEYFLEDMFDGCVKESSLGNPSSTEASRSIIVHFWLFQVISKKGFDESKERNKLRTLKIERKKRLKLGILGSLTATTASAIAFRVVDELRWCHLASSSSSAGSITVTSCFRGSNAVVELLWFRAVSSCYSRSIAFAVASCSSWLKAVASCSSTPRLLIATTAFASVSRRRRRLGSIVVACAFALPLPSHLLVPSSWFCRPSLLLPCVCSFLSPYQAIVKG